MNTIPEMWTYDEAARYLRIRPDSLRRKVMLGQVPAHRPFGKRGRVLFDPDELREFIRNSAVPTTIVYN